jgi:hypothetical protein
MIKGFLLALLMVPTIASALDLKFGLMHVRDPLYNGVYYDRSPNGYTYPEAPIVGRVELIQRFKFDKNASFNIFATHMSQFSETDPHYGINAIGAELEFNFNLWN